MKLEKLSSKLVYSSDNFTKKIVFDEDEKVLNFILNFKPGQGVGNHQHDDSNLVIHVLCGKGEMTINDSPTDVVKDDIIYCTGDEFFSMKNIGDENLSLFVIIAPNKNPDFAKEI